MTAATCAGCGCACDDIEVAVAGDGLERVSGTCPLGDAWFAAAGNPRTPPAQVDGREAEPAAAVGAAAAILRDARLPLVFGLGRCDEAGQRAAVALAEAAGGVVDPVEAAGTAAQAIGTSTTTFGDVRDRADLMVAWRADPLVSNPRLLPRLCFDRAGRPADRELVVVDDRRTATAAEADAFVELAPGLDVEALWALRALARDVALDRELAAALPLDVLGDLAERLRASRYGVVLHGPAPGDVEAAALLALVRDLARLTHVVALPLRRDAGARGAEDVLAWRTGHPSAVSFARGHPRGRPGELSAAGLLARGEADAALVVGLDALAGLPPAAAEHLGRIPLIAVGGEATEAAPTARVAFATAVAGIHREGVVHRMDGVPVPLRAPLPSERPGDAEVLAAITATIRGEAG